MAPGPFDRGADDDESPRDGSQLVTLVCYSTPTEAFLLQSRLELEGIPAMVADANLVQTHPLASIAVGGVRVMVARSRLREARIVLAALRDGLFELDENFDVGPRSEGV